MAQFGFDTFLSPMTWRYGSSQMKSIWSEAGKRLALRRIWVAVAEVQAEAGLVTREQLEDLKAHEKCIDIERAMEIEKEIHHDLMAEIRAYAEQCKTGGGIIHLGCTSMDIEDNMDAMRLKEAVSLVRCRLGKLLKAMEVRIRETSGIRCMAFTHLQSAEPTTAGYRLAQTAQDLVASLKQLDGLVIKGKGFKGAVGTGASFCELLDGTSWSFRAFEDKVMERLGLKAFEAATQVYTRRQDLEVLQALGLLCAIIHKFALDFRILQASSVGEANEHFAPGQVGSSAMPFKRNPINCEKICSLCRLVRSYELDAWDNAALNILERTLDDSANRRVFLPEAFLAADEILIAMTKVIEGMTLNKDVIEGNFGMFGVFAATERLLMRLVRRGADRQKLHEVIREESLKAWSAVQRGEGNPLSALLASNPEIGGFMTPEEVMESLDASSYVGIAPERALEIADRIAALIS